MSRLATIIICLILSIIFGFFLLWPQYQKFSEERWHVKENEVERNNQEEYFIDIENLSKNLEGYEEQLSKIASALPSEPDVPALLDFLANAANNNGLSFENVNSFSTSQLGNTLGSTAAAGQGGGIASNIKGITIGFEVSGDYLALKNFLLTIEKSSRIIEVESISLKKKTIGSEKTESLFFDLKIKSYYY